MSRELSISLSTAERRRWRNWRSFGGQDGKQPAGPQQHADERANSREPERERLPNATCSPTVSSNQPVHRLGLASYFAMPAPFARDLCGFREGGGRPNTSDANDSLSIELGNELFARLLVAPG